MKRGVVIGFCLMVCGVGAQVRTVQYPFNKWKPDVLAKARAFDSSYLTHEETQVVFYMNLVRINPQLFCDTYLQKYMDDETRGHKDSLRTVHNSYFVSLKRDLGKIKSMRPLTTIKEL